MPSRSRVALVLLVIITLGGLGWRLWMVSHENRKPDDVSRLKGDEPGYDMFATELLEGRFFEYPFRVPIYPMFLAAVYSWFGHSPAAVIVVQAFIGAALIPLTYWLGRYVVRRRAALIAAAIVAFNYEMAYQCLRLYAEVLYTFLLLLSAIALYRGLRRPTVTRFSLAGVLLGVLNLCRPTGALLPAAIALALPWRWSIPRRIKLMVVYGLAMIVPIVPWTIHNYREHEGAFLPLAVSTAVLWQGSPEFYHRVRAGKTLDEIWKTDLNPKVNGGHSPHTIKGDAWFNRRAKESIKAEPVLWLRYCVQKAAYLWVGNPVVDWPFVHLKYYPKGRSIGIFTARLIMFAGVISLVVLAFMRRLRRFWPLIAILAYFTAIHAITFPETRYSYPLHPILALMIGEVCVQLARRLRPRRVSERPSALPA